jgi:hypothetical protein
MMGSRGLTHWTSETVYECAVRLQALYNTAIYPRILLEVLAGMYSEGSFQTHWQTVKDLVRQNGKQSMTLLDTTASSQGTC